MFMYSIEELINIILNKSEHLEELAKQKIDLKNLTAKQLHCIELIHFMKNPTLSELTDSEKDILIVLLNKAIKSLK
jgi:hypothetical protein